MDREAMVLLLLIGGAPVALALMLTKVRVYWRMSQAEVRGLLGSFAQAILIMAGIQVFWIILLFLPESFRDQKAVRPFILALFVLANWGPVYAVWRMIKRLLG